MIVTGLIADRTTATGRSSGSPPGCAAPGRCSSRSDARDTGSRAGGRPDLARRRACSRPGWSACCWPSARATPGAGPPPACVGLFAGRAAGAPVGRGRAADPRAAGPAEPARRARSRCRRTSPRCCSASRCTRRSRWSPRSCRHRSADRLRPSAARSLDVGLYTAAEHGRRCWCSPRSPAGWQPRIGAALRRWPSGRCRAGIEHALAGGFQRPRRPTCWSSARCRASASASRTPRSAPSPSSTSRWTRAPSPAASTPSSGPRAAASAAPITAAVLTGNTIPGTAGVPSLHATSCASSSSRSGRGSSRRSSRCPTGPSRHVPAMIRS